MPKLVKGGKYVYGWSRVRDDGTIRIPDEPLKEYGYSEDQKVIVLPGSTRSGGFAITTVDKLENSPLNAILKKNPSLAQFKINMGELIRYRVENYCWTQINKQSITLPLDTLKVYGISPGDQLLSVRGSHLALAFLIEGPIYEEAKNHPGLEVY